MKWFLLALALACPGTPPCSGKGMCDGGACLCDQGFGGSDCSTEVPLYMEVTAIGPLEYQNMLGRYKLDGMYLMETPNPNVSPDLVKFIHYDPASNGWAVSKFNSTCIDDICFFAYAPNAKIPPKKGYVFGSPELHIYYKQLVFDEADKNSMLRPGYRLGFSYAPDATVPQYAALSEYNGRYVLQPRYVHMRHQKYAIFPITFNSPGKKWVVSGLLGEPRTRQILFTAEDPSDNRYMPPQGPWLPDLGFVIKPACRNHVGDLTCMHLQPACKLGGQDVEWIQQCCRDTCDNCPVSRALCPLPKRRDPFGAPTAPPADPIAPPIQVFAVPTAAPAPAASSPPLATQPPSLPVALLRKTKTQAAIAT